MDDDSVKFLTQTYGAVVAHRLLLEYLLAKSAISTRDPVAYVREIIATTIVSMGELNLGEQNEFDEILKSASRALELLGEHVELRLSPQGEK